MFLTSAPMSLVGVWTATRLEHVYGDSAQSVMGRVLGVALLLGAAGLFAKSFVYYAERSDEPFLLTRRDRLAALAIGFFGGFIVGLTSVGTGVFFGLTMLIVFPLRAAKVVGTDIFHAAALLWVAGFGHFIAGNVDMGAVGWLLIGSIPGVLLASQFTLRMPERTLRAALASVLLLSGIKLLDFPHADLALVVDLDSRSRGACPADRGRAGSPRLHGRGVRGHRGAQARAQPDLEHARREEGGARLAVVQDRSDRLPAAQAGPRDGRAGQRKRRRRAHARPLAPGAQRRPAVPLERARRQSRGRA
jgi:uncharacterized membrane protein YfcA